MLSFLLSLVGAGLVALLIHWYLGTVSRLEDIPGPPVPSLLVGNIEELDRAPMGTKMILWAKQYGQTYKIRGPLFKPWLILSDPRGVNHILQGKNYVRPGSDRMVLELFFGKGLFCAEGEEHRRMRKYLGPAFTLQSIQEVSHVIFDLAYNLKQQYEDMLDEQKDGVLDIAPNIHMLALDAISMTMFMHNVSASEGRIPSLLHEITNSPTGDYFTILVETLASIFPSTLYLPNPLKRYADNLRKEFGIIAEDVWAGKDGAGMHAKVLDALARQENTVGQPISKDEAVAQECIYELARNPGIQKKLRTELIDFQSCHGHFPNFEDLMSGSALPYLEAVTRETLRTKAVLREIGRVAVEDDVIPLHFPISTTGAKEVRVKAGQVIQVSIRDGINSDIAIWGPEAARFRPERWLEEDALTSEVNMLHAQGHMYTFGDGPKVCLGRTFAIAELKIVVSILICNFRFGDTGCLIDFYLRGGNTVKPVIRGREAEGVQMPLIVSPL
ncbi:cytochrome P450 [Gautieria morchelliformis]|nr:cytochrome P450 [Gautieria morchelliformis]